MRKILLVSKVKLPFLNFHLYLNIFFTSEVLELETVCIFSVICRNYCINIVFLVTGCQTVFFL